MFLVLLAFLVASLTGSLNPIFIRFATQEIPPITFTALRILLTVAVLYPIWQKRREVIAIRDLYKVLPYAINMGLYAIGIQYTSATMGAILYTLAPILSAILAVILLREQMSKPQLIGAMLAFFGTAILILGSIETRDIFSFGTPLGNILISLAVLSWGFYPIGIKSLTKKYANSTILFYGFVVTAILIVLILPIEWIIRPLILSDLSHVTFISVLGSSLIGTALYYFCYQWLIKHTTAFIGSLSIYGGTVAVAFYGFLFLGEHITGKLVVGAALVLFGVFLATTYTQLKKRM